MARRAVYAGQFYPGSRESLQDDVDSFLKNSRNREDAIGAISPHAGYIYSGRVAGEVLSAINPKNTYVILGPNHTGIGIKFGLDPNASWTTPIGEAVVDKELAQKIINGSKHIAYDELSNSREHSIEVQIPFLQRLKSDFKFVPIVVSDAPLAIYREIAEEIVRAVKALKMNKNVMILASSDMTHYEPLETAKAKDRLAIDAILGLDEEMLINVINDKDITMCGYAPAAIMISAAKQLGAKAAKLISYRTSGDTTGDASSVVGYAGIIVT